MSTSGPYNGHGQKQRDLVRMSPSEVDDFLHEGRTLTMCTLLADGSVHAIGMWYGFLDGQLALESKAKAQKVLNLRRDPRITCLVETGKTYEELRGVSVIGTAEIVEDTDRLWQIGVSVFDRNSGPYSDEAAPLVQAMLNKRVGIVVHPRKIVSWDHRKLGL